ncbi:hypothetical protein [Blastococcus sp. SYSU D00820]
MFALLQPVFRRSRTAEWRPDPLGREPLSCRRHRFHWVGEDSFSGASMYACHCGVVRPGP